MDPLNVMIRERFLHSLPSASSPTLRHVSSMPSDSATLIDFSESIQPQRSPNGRAISDNTSVALLKNADPFVSPDRSVFDIRIKRVTTEDGPPVLFSNSSSSRSRESASSFSHFHEIGSVDPPTFPVVNSFVSPAGSSKFSSKKGSSKEVKEPIEAVVEIQLNETAGEYLSFFI
jgi:hypothetical protein